MILPALTKQEETIKIVSYTTKNPDRRAELREGVEAIFGKNGYEIVFPDDDASAEIAMENAEVLFAWTISEAMFKNANRLKWVHISGAGVEHNLFPAFRESSVLITNARGIHGPYISEWVLGSLFYIAQRFSLADTWRHDHQWRAAKDPMTRTRFLLDGKKALIVGYGSIGKAVVSKLTYVGIKCEAIDPTPYEASIPLHASNRLSEIIHEFDIVIISLPLTAKTENLFNADLISRMKQDSILVNVSRGKIINQAAIIQALKNGPLAYAALDVFQVEPLPEDSPLFALPNLFMTPHISGNFPEYTKLAVVSFLRNLEKYKMGLPLENIVSKTRGY